MEVLITCGGCQDPCEDAKELLCGFYWKNCVQNLLKGLDPISKNIECLLCKQSHEYPGNGFLKIQLDRYNKRILYDAKK